MSVVAKTLGVSRSNLNARLTGSTKPRRRYLKAHDAAVVPLITALVVARPTYGYRRITAILNRQLRATNASPVNQKRVYRIMQGQNLLLARHYSERSDRTHNGKIVTIRSNLRCAAMASSSPAGTVRSFEALLSSMPTTARSSPGAPS
jgi:hypothetical protein